ncbi:hypothetical protein HYALB_00011758 [Hymenoscyphus albidus]|uniref:Secreted protein n=1 Tax=Hymenoscyphus albidus TaxID=595503 RepID=A0A9N9Q970_9HELO|nr:hypothetical protein HYALB_00011758 [Hymenoscyphus albidus]
MDLNVLYLAIVLGRSSAQPHTVNVSRVHATTKPLNRLGFETRAVSTKYGVAGKSWKTDLRKRINSMEGISLHAHKSVVYGNHKIVHSTVAYSLSVRCSSSLIGLLAVRMFEQTNALVHGSQRNAATPSTPYAS